MAWNHRAVIDQLNREWAELAADHHPWQGDPTLPDGRYRNLLSATRGDQPDAVLHRLLTHHRAGDHRAGRVVLQAMLPKMVLLARQDRRATMADYLAELWLRIETYPLERRPGAVAANLYLDTRKAVRSADPRELPTDPEALQPVREPESSWRLEDVLLVAGSLGLVDAGVSACLRAVYGRGLRSHEAAAELAISPELVRYRTSRAVRRLAAHAPELIAAA